MATRKRAIGDDHNVAFGAVIGGPKARSLAIWLFSVFRAKFAYETPVHANRFLVPIDFPLSCVDTVNKVIPDRHDGTLLTSGASGHQPSLSSRRICPVVK